MCSGRVDPQFILLAFSKGADGVFIGGCHPGDCHYVTGNYKTYKRVQLLKKLLNQIGISEERLRLEWINATEGKKFAESITDFIEKLKRLPPIKSNGVQEKDE